MLLSKHNNGLIVNGICFLMSTSQTRSLLRPGSVFVRLKLPLKSVARGWKSLNGDHKNAMIVVITEFRETEALEGRRDASHK